MQKLLNLTKLVSQKPNQYGQDASITTGQTKEERAAKVKASYIGNGKTVYDSNNTPF